MGLFVASSQMIHIVYFLFQMGLWHHMLAYLSSRARSSLGYKQKFMRRGPCFSFFVYQSKVVAAYNTCLPRLPEYLIIHDILGPTWCISPGLLNANKAWASVIFYPSLSADLRFRWSRVCNIFPGFFGPSLLLLHLKRGSCSCVPLVRNMISYLMRSFQTIWREPGMVLCSTEDDDMLERGVIKWSSSVWYCIPSKQGICLLTDVMASMKWTFSPIQTNQVSLDSSLADRQLLFALLWTMNGVAPLFTELFTAWRGASNICHTSRTVY